MRGSSAKDASAVDERPGPESSCLFLGRLRVRRRVGFLLRPVRRLRRGEDFRRSRPAASAAVSGSWGSGAASRASMDLLESHRLVFSRRGFVRVALVRRHGDAVRPQLLGTFRRGTHERDRDCRMLARRGIRGSVTPSSRASGIPGWFRRRSGRFICFEETVGCRRVSVSRGFLFRDVPLLRPGAQEVRIPRPSVRGGQAAGRACAGGP